MHFCKMFSLSARDLYRHWEKIWGKKWVGREESSISAPGAPLHKFESSDRSLITSRKVEKHRALNGTEPQESAHL